MTSCEPVNGKSSFAILDKINKLQEEIALINLHGAEHIRISGEVQKVDPSCLYCQPFRDEPKEAPQLSKTDKKIGAYSELEKTVMATGKNGHVIVPRSWVGKRVKITLVVN